MVVDDLKICASEYHETIMGRRCKLLWRLGSNPGRMMCRLSWLSGISRWWTILDTTYPLLYLILDLISCYHPMPPILLTCLLWYTFDDAKGEDFSTYFWFIFLLHLLMFLASFAYVSHCNGSGILVCYVMLLWLIIFDMVDVLILSYDTVKFISHIHIYLILHILDFAPKNALA